MERSPIPDRPIPSRINLWAFAGRWVFGSSRDFWLATLVDVSLSSLLNYFEPLRGVVVAFSGGVDSSVVAAAAHRALGSRAVAVTAQSPSVAEWQIEMSRQIASQIGIKHHIVATDEGQREDYRRNDSQRCFYCKSTLYESLAVISRWPRHQGWVIASGTNADDHQDHRPGLRAGELAGVQTPLADVGWGKDQVRAAARALDLANAELPASPCLASRIAYGVRVTPERLGKVERGEAILRDWGFRVLRVRLVADGPDDAARLEVPPSDISRLKSLLDHDGLAGRLIAVGFARVEVDDEGFRSGKMNDVLYPINA